MDECRSVDGGDRPFLFAEGFGNACESAAKPKSEARSAAEPARPRLRLLQREQGQMFLESHEQRVEADRVVRTSMAATALRTTSESGAEPDSKLIAEIQNPI